MKRKSEELYKDCKRLKNIIGKIMHSVVLVEGKKDVAALRALGIKALAIAGRDLSKLDVKGRVVVLTDLDRRGDELAKKAKAELEWRRDVEEVDIKTREEIGGILHFRHFENMDKKLREFEKEKGVIICQKSI